ncbi:MAG: class I SAM-dependent methyltransferase [Solirubrobacterales bacterium]
MSTVQCHLLNLCHLTRRRSAFHSVSEGVDHHQAQRPSTQALELCYMKNSPIRQYRLEALPVFADDPWQMSYGERTVLEGMLSMIKPSLALEIGRAEGGSLRRIAAHSERVISLDLVDASHDIMSLPNVRALSGDSHALLPAELEHAAATEDNIDFVLVDGDHSAQGVRQDMEDLLNSRAISQTVILAHDTLNEEVRQGLQEVDYEAHEHLAWIDLDFVPGYVARLPERFGECWGGLGLIVIDDGRAFRSGGARHSEHLVEQPKLVWPVAQWLRTQGVQADAQLTDLELIPAAAMHRCKEESLMLQADLERHQAWLRGIQSSASWRLTSPLRNLKRRLLQR